MIPDSMTKPIRAITLISLPVIHRAKKPPVKASGIVNMIMNGDRRLWNWATMMR